MNAETDLDWSKIPHLSYFISCPMVGRTGEHDSHQLQNNSIKMSILLQVL